MSRDPSDRRSALRATAVAVGALVALAATTALLGFTSHAAAAPPANTKAPAITGVLHAGQKLTADPGSWIGDAPITFVYSWQRCDAKGTSCVDAINGSSQTYTLGSAAVGATFRVGVKATNAAGVATAISATSPPVAAAPVGEPAATGPPTVSGTPVTGSTLSVTPGTWTGAQPLSYTYVWQRCDANGGACQPIPNANRATYALAPTDAGATFRVVVTAANAGGSTTATSVPTAKVTPGQAGILALPGGMQSVPAETLALPDRLIIEHVSFDPPRLPGRVPFKVTVRVTDTRGFVVRNARVFILGVPYSRVGHVDPQTTGTDGTVTLSVSPLAGLEVGRGKYLVFFVRAIAPDGKLLAGVSTRRLVQIRTGPPA